MAFDAGFAPTQLAARAAYLLRGNDLGAMTSAAPRLYPHMWSWDAAFVAVGLASLSVERAVIELDTLLSAQWANGMIPHIVFAEGVTGYFPGPERWACSQLAAAAPPDRQTSGITQPPVHAIAVQRILDRARARGRSTRAVAEGAVRRKLDGIRVLAKGDVSSKLELSVTGASQAAVDAVAKAGGSLTVAAAVEAAE